MWSKREIKGDTEQKRMLRLLIQKKSQNMEQRKWRKTGKEDMLKTFRTEEMLKKCGAQEKLWRYGAGNNMKTF